MLFRLSFALAYILFVAGVGRIAGPGFENAVVKAGFLAAAFAFLLTRKVDWIVIGLLVLTFMLVLGQAMFTVFPHFRWVLTINALNQFFIVFALMAGIPTAADYRPVLIISALSAPLFLVFAIFYQAVGLQPLMVREFATSVYRLGGQLNPAFVSGLAMCGAFSALQLSLANDRRFIALAVFNILILLAAGGRMTLVCAVLMCTAAIFLSRHVDVTRKALYVGAGLIAMIPMAAVYGPLIIARFTEAGSNGRELMWSYLHLLASKYPGGIGFGHQYFNVPDEVTMLTGSSAAHNDFVRLGVELGQFGAVVFYLFVTLAVLRIALRRIHSGGLLVLVAYASFLLLSYSDNALATPPYFPIVFLAYVANLRSKTAATGAPVRRRLTAAQAIAERRLALAHAAEAAGETAPRSREYGMSAGHSGDRNR